MVNHDCFNAGFLLFSQVEGFDEFGKPLERITKAEQLQVGNQAFGAFRALLTAVWTVVRLV